MLRLMGGILRPTTGTVMSSTRPLGLFDLNLGFDARLNCIQNLYLKSLAYGLTFKEAKNISHDAFEFSQLSCSPTTLVGRLSAGMQMRLGFSLAMQLETSVLLIDEVLGVGDSKFQEKAKSSINKKLGKASCSVICSHDVGQIKSLCNKVLYLRDGMVTFLGDVDAGLLMYANAGK